MVKEDERETCSDKIQRVSFEIFTEDDIRKYMVVALCLASGAFISSHSICKQRVNIR